MYSFPDPSVSFEVKLQTPVDVELLFQKAKKAPDWIIFVNRRHIHIKLKYLEFFKKSMCGPSYTMMT